MVSIRDTRDELRCLRYPDLVAAGIVTNKQTLYRWIRSGYFPRPIRLGPNVTAWRWSEIRDWLEDRERIVTDSERREAAILEELRAERAERGGDSMSLAPADLAALAQRLMIWACRRSRRVI